MLMGAMNFLEALSRVWKKSKMSYKDLTPFGAPCQGFYFAAFM